MSRGALHCGDSEQGGRGCSRNLSGHCFRCCGGTCIQTSQASRLEAGSPDPSRSPLPVATGALAEGSRGRSLSPSAQVW